MKISGPAVSGNELWAAVPDDFLDRSPIPPVALRNTDRFTQFAMVATTEALGQARLDPPAERTAVIVGNTMGGFPLVAQAQTRLLESGGRTVTPKLMALVIPNMPSALIAMHWNLHGPQLAISTACASSLDAIGLASGMIERGEIDAAIAGGCETLLSPLVYESLVRAGALSRNSDATKASRPFDVDRDGFVMGDGAAILVLERIERARERGARVLARIRGYGFARRCLSYYVARPIGALRSARNARCSRMRGRRRRAVRGRVRARDQHDRRRRRGVEGDRRRLRRSASDRHFDQRTRRTQHGRRRRDVRDRRYRRDARRVYSAHHRDAAPRSGDAFRLGDGTPAVASLPRVSSKRLRLRWTECVANYLAMSGSRALRFPTGKFASSTLR